MEDMVDRKMRVSQHLLTCYLDGELFLLEQKRVLDGARHIVMGLSLDNHRCFQIEQALSILDNRFRLWR